MSVMPGMGPDAPITKDKNGGSQSDLPYRFDLIDTSAWLSLARILDYGAKKHGESNWRVISDKDHVNHAMAHLVAYLHGDQTDDHLVHAFARVMMAIGVQAKTATDERYIY